MMYMWFTGINYYNLAIEKDRDSIFTTIWKPGFVDNWRQIIDLLKNFLSIYIYIHFTKHDHKIQEHA
jgi:hypothetical protein